MFLEELNIINFKNIASRRFSFSEKMNCLVGDNGAGKTNILDSLHYLSLCKSGWGLSDRMCVRHGEEFFLVEGNYRTGGEKHERIVVSFNGKVKSVKRNGKEYGKLSEHIGLLPFVMVSPYDGAIINESGEERRRFLNSLISQLDATHMGELMRYNNLLEQRNKILRSGVNSEMRDVLPVIDLQMSETARAIHRKRRAVIEELAPKVVKHYRLLSDGREEIEISYRSQLSGKEMEELLVQAADRDRIMGHTTVGVHRDDIKMAIEGHPIRNYGSQGQQKSFIVALKLAQHEMMHEKGGSSPLLLLDDIFDKLDLERVARLIGIVSADDFEQIFISDCNRPRLETILERTGIDHKIFDINEE